MFSFPPKRKKNFSLRKKVDRDHACHFYLFISPAKNKFCIPQITHTKWLNENA